MRYVVKVAFHDEGKHEVAVLVAADDEVQAGNRAFEAFMEDGPSEVEVLGTEGEVDLLGELEEI
jgi:hypothetical protein